MGLGAVIGLDIGNTTIKVAEVRAHKGNPQVTALGIAPTPLDSVSQSLVIDPGALASVIKELLASCGASCRKVVSSVSGQQSLVVRIIEVPRMTEKELAETMKWELERHVPFATQDVEMNYRIIERPDTPPDSQTMEVLLVVAQQEMIGAHLEVLEGAGLTAEAIDVEPLALARALVDIQPEQAARTIAIANIGAQITDVSIVRDGLPLFQRTIATAGDALTQAIAAQLNISNEEAERVKKTRAVVDLDAFAQPAGTANVFEADTPFGFGSAPFETPGEPAAGGAGAEPTMFNPFASDSGEASPGFSPFAAPPAAALAPAEPAAPAAQPGWSPFDLSGSEAPADAANPFAAAEPAPAAEAVFNPFGEPAAAADGGDADGFDLTAFGVDESAATAVGGDSPDELTPQQVFGMIREPLTDLVAEIKRSLDYFRGRAGDASIDALIISGGTARLPNLDQLLSSELGVPVVVANPFEAVPVQATQYPEEYLAQVAPLFAVSVGLGLRETVF